MRNYSERERLAHIRSHFEYLNMVHNVHTQKTHNIYYILKWCTTIYYYVLKSMASPSHFYKEPSHQVHHVMTSTCINILPLHHPSRVSCSTCLVLVITSLNSSVRALPPDPAVAATAAAWRGGFGGTATVPGAMPAERWRTWWNTTRRDVTHTSGYIELLMVSLIAGYHFLDWVYFSRTEISSLPERWAMIKLEQSHHCNEWPNVTKHFGPTPPACGPSLMVVMASARTHTQTLSFIVL